MSKHVRQYEGKQIKVVGPNGGTEYYPSFDFIRTSELETERNWGADADGRRGENVVCIQSDQPSNIYVNDVELEFYREDFAKCLMIGLLTWLEYTEIDTDYDDGRGAGE